MCRRLQAEGARIVVGDIGEERVLAAAASLGEGALWRIPGRGGPSELGRRQAGGGCAGLAGGHCGQCSGIVRDRSLAKMSDAEWSAVIDVNLRGTWLGCQSAFAWIGERGWGASSMWRPPPFSAPMARPIIPPPRPASWG